MKRIFTPESPNDFQEFIATYFERCRAIAPEIEGIAGKWSFEDLIQGLSDFDTRFLMCNGLTAADWSRISMAVAKVHLDLALSRPEWARKLEHLPGVNLTWEELFDPANYYCEFRQWTFHDGLSDRIRMAREHFSSPSWQSADAHYHWKRIALYFDRYSRTIDPPINLGAYESKYPLHSRFLHYFAPPVHSAVCLYDQHTTPGKMQALRRAQEIFPESKTMQICLDAIGHHYETPALYEEPHLTGLETELFGYLTEMIRQLLERSPIPGFDGPVTPAALRQAVGNLPGADPRRAFFENIRFARLMQGRLWFFSHSIKWFDSLPLIGVELGRIGKNFIVTPLELIARLIWGERVGWSEVLDRLEGDAFSTSEVATLRRLHQLADPTIGPARFRARAAEIVTMYPDFLECLDKLQSLAFVESPLSDEITGFRIDACELAR